MVIIGQITLQLKLNVSNDKSKTVIMTTDLNLNLEFSIYKNTIWETKLPILRGNESYRYLGFHININLDWDFHINKTIQPLYNLTNLQMLFIQRMHLNLEFYYNSKNKIYYELCLDYKNKIKPLFASFTRLLYSKLKIL